MARENVENESRSKLRESMLTECQSSYDFFVTNFVRIRRSVSGARSGRRRSRSQAVGYLLKSPSRDIDFAVIFLPRCEELRDVGDLTLGDVPLMHTGLFSAARSWTFRVR